jgi:feruloyl-CoA synthase
LERPPPSVVVTPCADGSLLVESGYKLESPSWLIVDLIEEQAELHPERVYLAERGPDRAWRQLTYADLERQTAAVASWLIAEGVEPGERVMILSENSIAHAVMMFGAFRAGAVAAPVSPAYSLADDLALLHHVAGIAEPTVVFAEDSRRFARALGALQRKIVTVDGGAGTSFARLLQTPRSPGLADRRRRLTAEHPAKILFTSGSTGQPKGVVNTHGNIVAAMQMARQIGEKPDPSRVSRLLDWLPWHHVFGGNVHLHGVLRNAGSLWIDDGRPIPGRVEATIANLREVAPSSFSSVPAAFAILADALEEDDALRKNFFSNLRFMSYGGALLPQDLCDRFQRLAVQERGARIPFSTGWGMTETSGLGISCYWHIERTGMMGLPLPGATLKLLPLEEGRYELRVKGPHVMPGYYQRPDLDEAAFDAEGFFRTGDAVTWADPSEPHAGLRFGGRLAEQFKLLSGTWVQAGLVRLALLNALQPLAREVVIAGADRPFATALVWLDPAGQGREAELAGLLAAYNRSAHGSSREVRRIVVLDDVLSIPLGELTDKRSVNQRRVIERRPHVVEALYAEPPGPGVIVAKG